MLWQKVIAASQRPINTMTATVLASSYNSNSGASFTLKASNNSIGIRIATTNRWDTEASTAAQSGYVRQNPLTNSNGTTGTLYDIGGSVHWQQNSNTSDVNGSLSYATSTVTPLAVNTNFPTDCIIEVSPTYAVNNVTQRDIKSGGTTSSTGGSGTLSISWPGGPSGFLLVIVRAYAGSTCSVTSSDVTLGSKLVLGDAANTSIRWIYFVSLGGTPAKTINLSHSGNNAYFVQAQTFTDG